MTINLGAVTFDNDYFATDLPSGVTLIMYSCDESIKDSNTQEDVEIKEILLVIEDAEGNQTLCSSVIGMSNDFFSLKSDFSEMQDKKLNVDNKEFCYIEVAE